MKESTVKRIAELAKSISITESELINFIIHGLSDRIKACPGQNVGFLLHPDEAILLIKALKKYQRITEKEKETIR